MPCLGCSVKYFLPMECALMAVTPFESCHCTSPVARQRRQAGDSLRLPLTDSSLMVADSHKHKDKHKDREHRHKEHKKDKEKDREKSKHSNR